MGLFDKPGWYKLRDENAHLQPAIDWFSGSFDHDGYAVKGGFNAAAVLNPTWADQEFCQPDESPIACEVRIHNPSFAIVSLELSWLIIWKGIIPSITPPPNWPMNTICHYGISGAPPRNSPTRVWILIGMIAFTSATKWRSKVDW